MAKGRRTAARKASRGLRGLAPPGRPPAAAAARRSRQRPPTPPALRPRRATTTDGVLVTGGLTAATRAGLRRLADVGVTAAGLTASGGWVGVGTDGSVVGENIPAAAEKELRKLIDAGHHITHISFAPDDANRWAILTSRTAVLGKPPAECKRTVEALIEGGQTVDRVVFAAGGKGWLVLADGRVLARGVPGRALQTLRNLAARPVPQLAAGTRPVDEVAFTADGGWVVTAGDFLDGEDIPKAAALAIADLRGKGRLVDTVTIGPAGAWVVASTAKRPPLPDDPLRTFEKKVPRTKAQPTDVASRLRASRVPGAAIAGVVDNQVTWVTAYGTIAAGSPHPVLPETVFQTASLAKPTTALGLLRLVDAGAIGLDEDIRPHLAYELAPHPSIAKRTKWPDRPVTVRLLLQHRAGIIGRGTTPDRSGRKFTKGGGGSFRLKAVRGARVPSLRDSWAGKNTGHPVCLTYEPGTKHSYSGSGYLVLQHLVEQVTGEKFDEWMGRYVLAPLGMTNSTFSLRPPPKIMLAAGHDNRGRPLEGGYELTPWSAAGGLFSTAGDIARLIVFLNQRGTIEGQTVLSKKLAQLALTESLGIFADGNNSDRYSHTGTNGGFRSYLVGWADRGRGIVVVTNGSASDGEALRNDLAAGVRKAYGW